MSTNSNQTNYQIQVHSKESVKQFLVYDGLGRMIEVYTANSYAQGGDPCMATFYSYTTPTSGLVQAMKEVPGTWLAIWDF